MQVLLWTLIPAQPVAHRRDKSCHGKCQTDSASSTATRPGEGRSLIPLFVLDTLQRPCDSYDHVSDHIETVAHVSIASAVGTLSCRSWAVGGGGTQGDQQPGQHVEGQ